MYTQFDILKYDFVKGRLSNIPPSNNDIKLNEEEAAYYLESGKIKVTCCCGITSERLKKLYDFKDFITETDYKIFKESLMKHPFGNHFKTESNEQPTREDLLEAIIKIKDWAGYIGHIDLKNYFLECMQKELTMAAKKVERYGDPTSQLFFEKKWDDIIRENIVNTDDLLPKQQFYRFEDWLNGETEIPNGGFLVDNFAIPERMKIIEHSKKLILERAEIKYNELILNFKNRAEHTYDINVLLSSELKNYHTILEKDLTDSDFDIEHFSEDHKVINVKISNNGGFPYDKIKGIRKHYAWFIDGSINAIVANPQNEDSFKWSIGNTYWCINAIAFAKFHKFLKEYNIVGETLPLSIPSVIASPHGINEPEINYFCKDMSVAFAREHFKVFTINNSKNNRKPFLTNEQFELFIKKAFLNDKSIEKLTFNWSHTKENLFISKRFWEFYDSAVDKEYTTRNDSMENYIRLLTDNFTDFKFEKIVKNFGNKVKRQWLLL